MRGLKHARVKGKRLGRPKRNVDAAKVIELRQAGKSWRALALETGVGIGTVFRAAKGSKF